MGAAWILDRSGNHSPKLDVHRDPRGAVALNGGGSSFGLGKAYSPVIMLLHAAPVMPAILMATWMTIFHLRSAKAHVPTNRTPSTPNSQ